MSLDERDRGTRQLRFDPSAVESVIGRVLVIGNYVAMLFILIGVLGMLASSVNPLTAVAPASFDIASIPADMVRLRPEGFLWLGIVTIIALPIGRVVFAGISLLAAGERRLALVSMGVLLVVLVSIVAAIELDS